MPHRANLPAALRRRQTLQWLAGLSLTCLHLPASASAWQVTSDGERYRVSLQPREQPVRIGRFQSWVLTVSDRDGAPVSAARISLSGGMAAHGHGLPSAPQIRGPDNEGRWLIEGLHFNMPGQWQLQFVIDTPAGADVARFALQLGP